MSSKISCTRYSVLISDCYPLCKAKTYSDFFTYDNSTGVFTSGIVVDRNLLVSGLTAKL